jgi:hypothetical protein
MPALKLGGSAFPTSAKMASLLGVNKTSPVSMIFQAPMATLFAEGEADQRAAEGVQFRLLGA